MRNQFEKPSEKPTEKQVQNEQVQSKPNKKKEIDFEKPGKNLEEAQKHRFNLENRLKIAEQEAQKEEENQSEYEISSRDMSQELKSEADDTI